MLLGDARISVAEHGAGEMWSITSAHSCGSRCRRSEQVRRYMKSGWWLAQYSKQIFPK